MIFGGVHAQNQADQCVWAKSPTMLHVVLSPQLRHFWVWSIECEPRLRLQAAKSKSSRQSEYSLNLHAFPERIGTSRDDRQAPPWSCANISNNGA
nr:hypothetical protein CFP56_42049 [Quercus suber]